LDGFEGAFGGGGGVVGEVVEADDPLAEVGEADLEGILVGELGEEGEGDVFGVFSGWRAGF
jgi:hypothetical protein